eukprot:SAG22_NODE_3407_length_1731_cov_1.334559_4_plen_32_part_01
MQVQFRAVGGQARPPDLRYAPAAVLPAPGPGC